MNRRLIIGTDIGTDVDDLWTLAMCELCLNEIEKSEIYSASCKSPSVTS